MFDKFSDADIKSPRKPAGILSVDRVTLADFPCPPNTLQKHQTDRERGWSFGELYPSSRTIFVFKAGKYR
jgi:hypothetical protein